MKSIILSSKAIIDNHQNINFLIDQDLSIFLNNLNLKILPKVLKNGKINPKNLKNADGLILAGGGDLFKYKKNKINEIRDNYEKKLFKYFINKNKPILAICRGFQLVVDLYGIKLEKIKNHVRTTHNLKLLNSRFIKYSKLSVNSYHNYSITKLPKNFLNIASTTDKSIEIAEHKTKRILCLMFHPERKMISQKSILKSIKKFFK